MTIHKEGYPTLSLAFLLLLIINMGFFYFFMDNPMVYTIIFLVSIIFYLFLLQFFRSPNRKTLTDPKAIFAPADGKIVAIEQTYDNEYFNEKRTQVSIFMSVYNVHINWYPVAGIIKYLRYHAGKYLVAWHPKSSTENERTSIVIETSDKQEIMVRQIAGAMARRVVYYPQQNEQVTQNKQLGFIKFGSRVDLLLPEKVKINVKLNQKVTGSQTIIANFE